MLQPQWRIHSWCRVSLATLYYWEDSDTSEACVCRVVIWNRREQCSCYC